MKYTTSYSSSNGQPTNNFEIHETLNAALAAWETNTNSLLYRSGGDSTLQAWEDDSFDDDNAISIATLSWIEYCEGGFVTASGDWLYEISLLARYAEENGEILTVPKVVRYLSE